MNYGNYGGNYGSNDYSTTSYGAGGGAGAGGFFGGSQGGAGGSQASPGSASKQQKTNTLRPITIKQALEATQPHADAEFKIDDHDLGHITLVAQIRNISEQAAFTTYKVDDGTGAIDIKQYVDLDAQQSDDSNPTSSRRIPENTYVRILGQLRMVHHKRIFHAHSIRPITDFNEVLYHLLEATAIHLYFKRGPPEQFTAGAGEYGGGTHGHNTHGYNPDISMGGMGASRGGGYNDHGVRGGGGGGGGGGGTDTSGLSQDARNMLAVLKGISNPEGAHVKYLMAKLGMTDENQAKKARDELFTAGAAYTTLDDDHMAPL